MAELVDIKIKDKTFKVADIKKDFIENIIKVAPVCPHITRVYLFGSCLEERCREESDIDIAVFGDLTQSRMYRLSSFNKFYNSVINYFFTKDNWEDLDYIQDYDILYYKSEKDIKNTFLVENILNGILLYERK